VHQLAHSSRPYRYAESLAWAFCQYSSYGPVLDEIDLDSLDSHDYEDDEPEKTHQIWTVD
jgi:hypothetical protein